ncbi:hypothetical protein F1654_05660 [Alkalicaulis satelles]|uniref:Uncharacterized protein n=1 Tax=Alkalicaulis satelles TaxID=2609175 RepID=A0A5M6ZKW6_9PROT|nr:chromophore lyase CpcT/CpeT [Alkalicaulis satelles]KAA5805463.1 hypothetical protein F1654_05660 [Alkalicaulis satelles]
MITRLAAACTAALAALGLSSAALASPAEELAGILIGEFTTAEQSLTEGWGYVESRLVRVWPEREDGVWLYQENAWLGDNPGDADYSVRQRPYFQRLVQLVAIDDHTVIRTIYSMTDPASVVGAVHAPERIEADQLGAPNCSGEVNRIAAGWWIADFPNCPSNLRGAVRTRSQSIHTPDGFANWDLGLTAGGERAWGPTGGGYVFRRMTDAE